MPKLKRPKPNGPDYPKGFYYDLEDKLKHMAEIRNAMGISQREMAEILGVSHVSVAKWELGEWKTSRKLKNLIRLARLIDTWQIDLAKQKENT